LPIWKGTVRKQMKALRRYPIYFATLLLMAAAASGQVASDSTVPIIKNLPKPDYPARAKAAGIGGDVFVVMLIDKMGKAKVVDSYGPMAPCTDLNDPLAASVRAAGVSAAMGATFTPATFMGKPVDRGIAIRFIFDPLEGKDRPDDLGTVQSVSKENWPVAVRIPKAKYPREVGMTIGSIRNPGTTVGPIRIKLLIDENGRVVQAGAISGVRRVQREAAIDAICRSVFRPATRDGKPIKFEFIFEDNFFVDYPQK